MTYLKAKRDAYDYFSKHAVVEGELLTVKERNKLCPYLQDSLFETVVIPKSETVVTFGVRFEAHHLMKGGDN